MSSSEEHRILAETALGAAERMRESDPLWALVPLFYSAMHLMHARFDEDELEDGERHPRSHRRHYEAGVEVPGTMDVVVRRYSELSQSYRSLESVSKVARYHPHPTIDPQRFWDAYNGLARACGAREAGS